MKYLKSILFFATGTRSWRELLLFTLYSIFLLWVIFDILGVYQ